MEGEIRRSCSCREMVQAVFDSLVSCNERTGRTREELNSFSCRLNNVERVGAWRRHKWLAEKAHQRTPRLGGKARSFAFWHVQAWLAW
jgi:hypothetical protein